MNVQSQPAEPPRPHSGRSNAVLVLIGVIGGAVLLITILGATLTGLRSAAEPGSETQTHTLDVSGIDDLEIRVGSAEFTVVFDGGGGSDTALLEVEGARSEWRMGRDDSTLQVDSGSFAFGWIPFFWGREQQVVLHLPQSMRTAALDADLRVDSGSLGIDADFGEVEVTVSSGSARLDGSAESLDARVSSGVVHAELADVREAVVRVSSGKFLGEFLGTASHLIDLRVSSGSANLTLPDESYAVSTSESSGSIENLLRTDPASRHRVDANVSSGHVTLQATDSR